MELPDLTEKQYNFVQGLLRGLTASDAYREAYPDSNMTGNVLWVEASKTKSLPNVAIWLNQAKQEQLSAATYTIEDHLKELDEIRLAALSSGQYSAATQATQNKGKVSGHYIDQIKDLTTQEDTDLIKLIYEQLGQSAGDSALIELGIEPTQH